MSRSRPPVPRALARPATWLYARAVSTRNRRFDAGRGVHRIGCPVISVGNLSVGGTGKTPTVLRVCRWLLEAGMRPCVAMRGYKARAGVSDEAQELAQALPGVPVVAQPDRIAGLRALLDRGTPIDAVVLDDGFQHRRLARDLDIVLIDATRDPRDDALLPLGWLREPVTSLVRADAVLITHAESAPADRIEDLVLWARATAPGAVVSVAEHQVGHLEVNRPDGAETVAPDWLADKRALAACAIGSPDPFIGWVRRQSGTLAGAVALRDHHAYDPATVRRIARAAEKADVIVTTAKDWVKLRGPAGHLPVPVAVARLRLNLLDGEDDLRRAVLRAVGAPDAS